jgi:hypothetical protein
VLDAAAVYSKKRLVRRNFHLAKLDLTAWFSSRTLAELCDKALFQPNAAESPLARAQIHIIDASAPDWERPRRWQKSSGVSPREIDNILAARELRGFYHHEGPSWQFYDRATASGVMTLAGPLWVPPWEIGSPLRLFLHWAYAAAGLRLTHAATLGINGRGALIVGASGAGKSSTALAGLLNGLDSVGDDYVLVEQGRRVVAHPVFSLFKQAPEALRRIGIEMPPNASLNWQGKIEFDPQRLFGKELAREMDVLALFVPKIVRHHRTTIERLKAHEAGLALAPSSVFQLPGDQLEGFGFLAGLVRRLPAFQVNLSEEPAEIADAIGSFMSKGGRDAG